MLAAGRTVWPGDPPCSRRYVTVRARRGELQCAFLSPYFFTVTRRVKLTNWHRRRPPSVVPAHEFWLTVQHVVRFAADGHVFAGSVRVLRAVRVTVRRVSRPRTSDRYKHTNTSITHLSGSPLDDDYDDDDDYGVWGGGERERAKGIGKAS